MTFGIEVLGEKNVLEVVIALSSDFDCIGITEEVGGCQLFFEQKAHKNDFIGYIQSLEQLDFVLKEISYPDQNWNEIWEATFEKVTIDKFCLISAPFHQIVEKNEFEYHLLIDPKMAFGTGHHETTSGLVRMMRNISFKKKSVLDFGAGTAVLGILAEKMNADRVIAVDNDHIAVENGQANIELNNCQKIKYFHSSDYQYELDEYDVVFCNITRNVIREFLPKLLPTLKHGGNILFSGYIKEDKLLLESFFSNQGLFVSDFILNGEWCIHLCSKNRLPIL